jgi:hypothetical protein
LDSYRDVANDKQKEGRLGREEEEAAVGMTHVADK